MENRKKLNPNPVPFNIFGERLRVFFDEDRIRIMGTDAAEILGFANGRNAVARYCPDRITHPMKTDKGQLIQVSAVTEADMEKLFLHAHTDSTTLNVLRLLLLMEIPPRYEEYKKSVTKTKRKAVRIPRNNATPTQWKAAKPHVEETLDKPAQRKTGKRSARKNSRTVSGTTRKIPFAAWRSVFFPAFLWRTVRRSTSCSSLTMHFFPA